VDSVHLSAQIYSYNKLFAMYSAVRAKVTHKRRKLIPGKVWKAVYNDYKQEYPGAPFAEETLNFRVGEELSHLKTGTANQKNGRAALKPDYFLEKLRMTDNHAKRNFIQRRQLVLFGTKSCQLHFLALRGNILR
jgi:hypothetical protein